MSSNNAYPVSVDAARAALTFIPSNYRDLWWRIGMALKSEFGEGGYDLFNNWSESGVSFDAKAVKSTWLSFKPGGKVTIGTLIAEAKRSGFNPKQYAAAAPLSGADKARIRQERNERDRVAAAELVTKQEAAAVEAAQVWAGASEAGNSPYLVRKGVQAYGLRFLPSGTLLVPLRDGEGKLWNVQRIVAKGDKRFPAGGRVSGCFHVLGDMAASAWVLIAEGYATAATLHAATGHAVVVAFNEANVRHVAAAVRKLLPQAHLLLCADDDKETEEKTGKNPGIVSATAAAAAVGGYWCKPQGLSAGATDFNDLSMTVGVDAVRAQLATAITEAAGVAASAEPHAVAADAMVLDAPVEDAPAASGKKNGNAEVKKAPASKAKAGGKGAGQTTRPFFHVDDAGVCFHGFSQQGDPLPAQWICSELHISAQSRGDSNEDWGYLLEFQDGDGNAKRWAMPASMLAGDGTQYRATLLSMGLRIGAGTAAKNHLSVYIQTQRTDARVRCTDRIGWHDSVYVLPDRTIGE